MSQGVMDLLFETIVHQRNLKEPATTIEWESVFPLRRRLNLFPRRVKKPPPTNRYHRPKNLRYHPTQ